MKFIDFFAGIGGFRRGLELAGHECVGFCEWDKYATASYTSMHLITDKQREYLNTLTLKQRRKEILKDGYRNGEWYSDDIRTVDARSLPDADCWTFGAPCQDFSVAGKRKGLDGDRSSLVREIFRLLEEQEEKDRPEWLIYENVKGMLSSNRGLDYLSILSEMDRLGYDIEWQNINSKWFVPQNRERIYTIGHLRRYGSRKILPVTGTDRENSVSIIGHRDGYRRNTQTFSPDGITEALDTGQGGGRVGHVGMPMLCGLKDGIISQTDCSHTLMARDYKGIGNQAMTSVAIPALTPDRAEKRQNGRRFKENGDEMFTLTAQDRHGIAIGFLRNVRTEYGKSVRKKYESGEIKISRHKFIAYEIREDGISNKLSTVTKDNMLTVFAGLSKKENGMYIEMPGGFYAHCVWHEKYQCYIAIRKLTPKEYFRLQGWTDDYFEKANFVNSDSQLYKQAGNGVTVNVVRAIGDKMTIRRNN